MVIQTSTHRITCRNCCLTPETHVYIGSLEDWTKFTHLSILVESSNVKEMWLRSSSEWKQAGFRRLWRLWLDLRLPVAMRICMCHINIFLCFGILRTFKNCKVKVQWRSTHVACMWLQADHIEKLQRIQYTIWCWTYAADVCTFLVTL